jgi:hypothetical protein
MASSQSDGGLARTLYYRWATCVCRSSVGQVPSGLTISFWAAGVRDFHLFKGALRWTMCCLGIAEVDGLDDGVGALGAQRVTHQPARQLRCREAPPAGFDASAEQAHESVGDDGTDALCGA